MQHFDRYNETIIRHRNAEIQAKLEHRRLVNEAHLAREARAHRRGHVTIRRPLYRPLLASVGRRMVVWGTRLQRRYDDLNSARDVTLAIQNK